jgi:hypothetical protein
MEQHLQKIKDSYGTDFTVTFTDDNVLVLILKNEDKQEEEFINVKYGTLCTDDNMAELLVHYIIGRVNTYIINGTGNIQQIQASVDKMVKVLKKFNTSNWPSLADPKYN